MRVAERSFRCRFFTARGLPRRSRSCQCWKTIWCGAVFLLYIPCLARRTRWETPLPPPPDEAGATHSPAAAGLQERSGFDVVDEGTEGHIPLSALRPVHRAIAK